MPKQPRMLAVSVPMGKDEVESREAAMLRVHRRSAPVAPPSATESICHLIIS